MSCNCQLVAMGQQTNVWGRDCASLCSDCGNQFNSACVLNQQAVPYWVGRQRSSEIFQTELEGQRHTWFYLWLYLEQASKPGASRNPACNRVLCGWYCILLNLDLNAFVSFGSVHEVMKSPVPSGPSLPVAYTIQLCIQSVSKYNKAPSKVMLCTLLGIWETMESKIFFLIPYCFGGYVVRIYNSQ